MSGVISIGSDPEFVVRKASDGRPIAAPFVVQGTKYDPVKRPECSFFPDNHAVEMNIPPSGGREEFISNVRKALSRVQTELGSKYYLTAPASLRYPVKALTHPICSEFGCEPDFDAYKLQQNEIPSGAAAETFRSCGGHIHIGHREGFDFLNDPYGKVDAVIMMDAMFGMASVLLDDDAAAIERRNLYGKAGCHRPKSYGVEYRTPSNFWLRHPVLTGFVWDVTNLAMRAVEDGFMKKFDKNVLPEIINTGNVRDAKAFMSMVAREYPAYKDYFESVRELKASRTKFMSMRKVWGY